MREVCGKVVYKDAGRPSIRTICTKDYSHDGDCRDIFGNTKSPEGVYSKWSDKVRARA